jgi:glutamine amidotransferase-like uncharacterized protein
MFIPLVFSYLERNINPLFRILLVYLGDFTSLKPKPTVLIISFVLLVTILTVILVPPYLGSINQKEGAILIPMQTSLQPNWLNASKLVNTLLQLNVKVYMLSEPIQAAINLQSSKGDFVIPITQESRGEESLLSQYVLYLSDQMNVSTTKIPVNSQATIYPLNKAKVAIWYGGEVSGGSLEHTHALEQAGFNLAYVTEENMSLSDLSKFNVITFPGGGPYGRALSQENESSIKEFVSKGGGYLGTCGGSVLGVELGLLDAENAMKGQYGDWAGLRGSIMLNITDSSSPIVSGYRGSVVSTYYMGAFISRVGPSVDVVCTYQAPTENLVPFNPEIMKAYNFTVQPDEINLYWGTPSIIAGNYGLGKVVLSTTHPEILAESQRLFVNSIFYLSSGNQTKLDISEQSATQDKMELQVGNLQPLDTDLVSKAGQLMCTFNAKSSVGQLCLSALAETNYQVTGASGDYLKLYVDDVAVRSLAIYSGLGNLTAVYSKLQEAYASNPSAFASKSFSGIATSNVSLQTQVQQILNSIMELNGTVNTLESVNTQLASEMQQLPQIISLNQTSNYYPQVISLNSQESTTQYTLKEQVDIYLLTLTFEIRQAMIEAQFLHFIATSTTWSF